MKFTKVQGAGNDFVLVETDDMRRDWTQVAIDVCDRHFGIGADGLLLLAPSEVADFRMRIFNADGSEANACGNGLRCMVNYFAEKYLADSGTWEVTVEKMAGLRRAEVHKVAGRVSKVKTGMGEPAFGTKDIPVLLDEVQGGKVDIKSIITYPLTVGGRELELNLVSMGNHHAVYFSPEPVSDFPLAQLGPKVERHKGFPQAVNFEVVRLIDRRQIEARVWEIGVGETLACGSGACAITAAARLHGYVDNMVDIILPGGVLEVEWDGAGEVFLSGPAENVFSGEWPDKTTGTKQDSGQQKTSAEV